MSSSGQAFYGEVFYCISLISKTLKSSKSAKTIFKTGIYVSNDKVKLSYFDFLFSIQREMIGYYPYAFNFQFQGYLCFSK